MLKSWKIEINLLTSKTLKNSIPLQMSLPFFGEVQLHGARHSVQLLMMHNYFLWNTLHIPLLSFLLGDYA